jgi:hypothetical protein
MLLRTAEEQVRDMPRKSAKAKRSRHTTVVSDNRLYTLDVYLIGGPIAEAFAKQNPVICRTIEIRADQTLAELHRAIFNAFDREDQHLYEFQVGGQGPQDPNARCYVLPMAMKDTFGGSKPAGDVTRTPIGSIGLQVDDAFGYWFDFGDDWWHQINVVAIEPEVAKGSYPRVTQRVGASPPQGDDWEEEEEAEPERFEAE